MKFPATKTGHWPTGPVHVCDHHAEVLKNIGDAMSIHVNFTVLIANDHMGQPQQVECKNCINENKRKKQ